jgi:hypothetical protein
LNPAGQNLRIREDAQVLAYQLHIMFFYANFHTDTIMLMATTFTVVLIPEYN